MEKLSVESQKELKMIVSEASLGKDKYKTVLSSGRHVVIGDEPLADGGTDQGMSPYQFVLTGLAACKVMTLRFYADREQWPLDYIHARLEMDVQKREGAMHSEIKTFFRFEGPLTEEQKKKLLVIADRCPVHKLLNGSFQIESLMATSE